MVIYQLVFGINQGQVNCVFHDDENASSGIGPNGEFNCFTCGTKAHDSKGFIMRYFNVNLKKAARINAVLNRLQNYQYTKRDLTQEQLDYLKSIGIKNKVAKQYFFQSGVGKLMYEHQWNGMSVGFTWFNPTELSNYSASAPKYKYDKNLIGGMLTPYDTVLKYKTLIITEGEKDMLTAKSLGIPNVVAKVGGAKTEVIAGLNLQNKQVVLCYDCDEYGRDGAKKDAQILIEQSNCTVKIIDLNLKDKEDLNDYFIKYNKTKEDLYTMIKKTKPYVVPPEDKLSKVERIASSLTADEVKELVEILKTKEKETNDKT